MSNELTIEENKEYIIICFEKIFKIIDYKIKSADRNQITYGNEFSELIFYYDMQQYNHMIFSNLYYKNKKTGNEFLLDKILNILFEINTEAEIKNYHENMIPKEKAYAKLIEKHMLDTIKGNDFSWEEKLKNI